MNEKAIHDILLSEENYAEAMDAVVQPYLAERMSAGYCEREAGKRIFYARALADEPRGVVVISHGYTETIEKHLENIYYFLRGGYHVFMPEHCGHGRSYRLCHDGRDLSLVHVDDYMRYVNDLLFVSDLAAKEFPDLPLSLYGHSMGGGIAAAAAAHAPAAFSRLILSSPMIRPKAPLPWGPVCLLTRLLCLTGGKERYIAGHHPYDGQETFSDSASCSESRFHYYKKKRDKESLFQMSGGSYGWFLQTARLNGYLRNKAHRQITCPVLVFQAEHDDYVSGSEQIRFVNQLRKRQPENVDFIAVPGVKHEIFNSGMETLKAYWGKILG